MFFRKKTVLKDKISACFVENIQKAIEVLAGSDGMTSDADILKTLKEHGIDRGDSDLILVFLPIAFCRRLLPKFKWKDQYYRLKRGGNGLEEWKFSETETYGIIWQEVNNYYSNNPSKDIILKIAARSGEFQVINDLLNAGGKLEEIELTPLQIIL